jgi:signal peptidase I
MEPTLRTTDLLEIMPYNDRPVRVGDVVFFLPPESEQCIVHRVIEVTPEGIRTRGDNNTSADPFLLKPVNIIGQVIAAWQGQQRRHIRGGWRGRLVAELWRWFRLAIRSGYPLLRRYFRGDRIIRWVRLCVSCVWKPRIIVFQADAEYSAKLLLGTRIIGHYTRTQQTWHIHQPYRLLIDGRALPIL